MITAPSSETWEPVRRVAAWLTAPFRSTAAPDPVRSRRLRRHVPWLTGVAAVLMLVATGGPQPSDDATGTGAPFSLTGVFAAAVVALLAWRPLLAWRLAWGVALLWTLLGTTPYFDVFLVHGSVLTVLVAATVVTAVRHDRDLGWAVLAWTGALLALGARPTHQSQALILIIGLGLIGLVVDARRQRARARAEVVTERSARLEQEAHSLVLEERARIARELHDVVAHHMSMVAVQAETAQYRLGGVEEPVRDEFASIARSARTALNDVRGLLTVLRDGEPGAERAPQPSLDGLDALIDLARSAGGQIELEVVGERRPLPAALELGAYRIVQESLANAARHARGAAVRVVVAYREADLEVTVTNGLPDGALADTLRLPVADGGAARAGGHGLVGMRERAHLLRGRLEAGPVPDGGWQVTAVLPTEETAPNEEAGA